MQQSESGKIIKQLKRIADELHEMNRLDRKKQDETYFGPFNFNSIRNDGDVPDNDGDGMRYGIYKPVNDNIDSEISDAVFKEISKGLYENC